MPKRIQVRLSEDQQHELEQARDHHAKAYVRERAAAILKVAQGATLTEVGEHGLHRRHEPETVHGWINQYVASGLSGLMVKPGSGRKPKFFPSSAGGDGASGT